MPVYRRRWRDPATGETRTGSYYYKFDLDGETYKATVKTARTKKQAEEAERQARQAVHEGVYGVTAKRQLFSDFARKVYLPWAKQHRRQYRNCEIMIGTLCDFFDGRTLSQISPLAVEGFKLRRSETPTKLGGARSPHTVNSELTALSSVMALAVRCKLIRTNPCHGVRWLETGERPVRRLLPDEETALLAAAEGGRPFLAPMIRLALWTGFRQGELIALTRQAVDFARNRVFVFNPKWRKDHRRTEGVPMSGPVRALLSELCRAAPGDLLFPGLGGEKMPRHVVDSHFRAACERAGVVGFRFHDLRHEYGSRLGDADVNLKKIARLMGHARTKMTERYVHPTDDALLTATEIAARESSRIVPVKLRRAG